VAIHEVRVGFVRAAVREFSAVNVGLVAQSLRAVGKHDTIEQLRGVAFGAPTCVRWHESRAAPALVGHSDPDRYGEYDCDCNEKNW
jgi:hypothetical protein